MLSSFIACVKKCLPVIRIGGVFVLAFLSPRFFTEYVFTSKEHSLKQEPADCSSSYFVDKKQPSGSLTSVANLYTNADDLECCKSIKKLCERLKKQELAIGHYKYVNNHLVHYGDNKFFKDLECLQL